MIAETDKAWMAGILEIRGSLGLSSRGPFVQLTDDDISIVHELCRLSGVKASLSAGESYVRKQCSDHCPEEHTHIQTAPRSRFQVKDLRAAIIMYNLVPHIRSNKKSVVAAEAWQSFRPKYLGHMKKTATAMLDAGWRIPPGYDS